MAAVFTALVANAASPAAVVPAAAAPAAVDANGVLPPGRLIDASPPVRSRLFSPARRSPVDPSGAYDGLDSSTRRIPS